MTAHERDALWLQEQGLDLDPEEFSAWVDRETEYGETVEQARIAVAKMMQSDL